MQELDLQLPSEVVLFFPGIIVPKQRARGRKNSTAHYLPERYRKWKELAVQFMKANWQGEGYPMANSLEVYILYQGTHNGDGDNLQGAVMDVLVDAGVVPDDNLKHVPAAAWRWNKQKGKPNALITLKNIDFTFDTNT
jgi:Holliday junction resolvase RusA-like endonuclease